MKPRVRLLGSGWWRVGLTNRFWPSIPFIRGPFDSLEAAVLWVPDE